MTDASFHIEPHENQSVVFLCGDWQLGKAPEGAVLGNALAADCTTVSLNTTELGTWDSSLVIVLLHFAHWCSDKKIALDTSAAPEGLQNLLNLATDVPAYETTKKEERNGLLLKLKNSVENIGEEVRDTLIFVGGTTIAFMKWLRGKSKTRASDIKFFIEQSGPKALPIVTLISVSVGMILAYLGSVQLRQLGAQAYVANLVSIGMVREMGALMTAIIIAGRTGAAYAAQLGTMQVNEEIDALKTMGISSTEFLVLPRLIALIFIMPLLCIYADIIGMAGGALIALSMDVSFAQYILQTQSAVDWVDMFTGIFKSFVFGILISVAGCQAGLNCGRSSTAVGIATTNAVVRSIVYLVMADAGINVLFDKLGI